MRNGIWMLVVAAALAGCSPTETDKKNLQGAYTSYGARNFAQTETLAGAYIEKAPTAQNVDEAYYLRGLARYGRGDRTEAAADLQKAIDKSARADLKYKANNTLGDIAYEGNRWEEAAADYQKAMAFVPAASVEARVYFRLGASLDALGRWEQGRPFLLRIAAGPDAELAARARERLDLHAFSLQYGAFRDGTKAAQLLQQLKGAGINAVMTSEVRDRQPLFVVRAGSYPTWAEAEAARAKAAAKFPQVGVFP